MGDRFIDRFDVVLLDMGNTFMFGCDRFDGSMAQTYARLGGRDLSGEAVCRLLAALFESLLPLARDPAHNECFPRVRPHLQTLPDAKGLSSEQLDLLAEVFALHEAGTIEPFHVDVLRRLRQTHRLGVISNVWSDSRVFREAFRAAGIDGLMDVTLFSSDHGWIKPSRRLFDRALEATGCDRNRAVYVGDSLKRDVAGAHAAGIASVWVNAAGAPLPPDGPRPDRTIACLSQLLTL